MGPDPRRKYSSFVPDADEDVQGNVQPTFIGVFDTVAALGNGQVTLAAGIAVTILLALFVAALWFGWSWYLWGPLLALLGLIGFWYGRLKWSQWKYFSPNEKKPLRLSRISDWPSIWKYGHYAKWNLKNYDKWLDSDVGFARHALAIDEHRKNFPRVKWAMPAEAKKNRRAKTGMVETGLVCGMSQRCWWKLPRAGIEAQRHRVAMDTGRAEGMRAGGKNQLGEAFRHA
jgi:hypothetical protein